MFSGFPTRSLMVRTEKKYYTNFNMYFVTMFGILKIGCKTIFIIIFVKARGTYFQRLSRQKRTSLWQSDYADFLGK